MARGAMCRGVSVGVILAVLCPVLQANSQPTQPTTDRPASARSDADALGAATSNTSLDWRRQNLTDLSAFGEESFQQRYRTLLRLDLSHNLLTVLQNDSFSFMADLTVLDLSHNRLSFLHPGAFRGLAALRELPLHDNDLSMTRRSLPDDLFGPLLALETLSLHANRQTDDRGLEETYNDVIFQNLTSLEELSIVTFTDAQFDSGFSGLRNLRTLQFGRECGLEQISNHTFEAFRAAPLGSLDFSTCQIRSVDKCAFCGLSALKNLTFGHYRNSLSVGLLTLLEAMYGLRGSNMTSIILHRVQPSPLMLTRAALRHLHQVCVSRLVLSRNALYRIRSGALRVRSSRLLQCLESMDLSQNSLRGDTGAFVLLFTRAVHLKELRVERQVVYSLEDAACELGAHFRCRGQGPRPVRQYQLRLPVNPALTWLNLSSSFRGGGDPPLAYVFPPDNGLRVLDLSYNRISQCVSSVLGLGRIQTLDLSGNDCSVLAPAFLANMTSLRRFALHSAHLDPVWLSRHGDDLFRPLTLLQDLDLSANGLRDLQPRMLARQTRLRWLSLADNRHTAIPVDLNSLPSLTHLDLSNNALTGLTSGEREAIDALAAKHRLRIDLKANSFSCQCASLTLVRWLAETSAVLDLNGNYMCLTEDGTWSTIHQVYQDFLPHWRRCVGRRLLWMAVSLLTLQLLVLVTTLAVNKNWTRLRYAYSVLTKAQIPTRAQFRKDVYVAYADRDWRLACLTMPACLRGVRLLVRDLDLEEIPGQVRSNNILNHIDESWKVLLLVTPFFMRDPWAAFTTRAAEGSLSHVRPDRVVVAVFQPAPPPGLTLQSLLAVLPDRCVLHHLRQDAGPGHPQWDALTKAVLAD